MGASKREEVKEGLAQVLKATDKGENIGAVAQLAKKNNLRD